MNDPERDESLGSLVLGTELEKLAAQKWLTDQGLPENVTVGAFALHCLRDEGIEADGELANQVLWSCTGFPAFWHIGRHGEHAIECCSTQLRGWARVARRSQEKAGRLLNDPSYSFERALTELDADAVALTEGILEDD